MYLFFRSARLGPGSAHEEMAWAVSMTEKVNQISEADFSLWTPFMSPGVNTLIWTTFVDDLGVLEATNDKLMADSGYMMLLEQSARYASGDAINDGLTQLLHADMDPAAQPPAYVVVTTATLATGHYAEGVAAGIEIAQLAKKAIDAPVSFGIDATGTYGGVSWHSPHASIREVQRAHEALTGDQDFTRYLDEHTQCFLPTATQTVYRRLA